MDVDSIPLVMLALALILIALASAVEMAFSAADRDAYVTWLTREIGAPSALSPC